MPALLEWQPASDEDTSVRKTVCVRIVSLSLLVSESQMKEGLTWLWTPQQLIGERRAQEAKCQPCTWRVPFEETKLWSLGDGRGFESRSRFCLLAPPAPFLVGSWVPRTVWMIPELRNLCALLVPTEPREPYISVLTSCRATNNEPIQFYSSQQKPQTRPSTVRTRILLALWSGVSDI